MAELVCWEETGIPHDIAEDIVELLQEKARIEIPGFDEVCEPAGKCTTYLETLQFRFSFQSWWMISYNDSTGSTHTISIEWGK